MKKDLKIEIIKINRAAILLSMFLLLTLQLGCKGGLDYTDPGTIPRYVVKVNATGFDQLFSNRVDLMKNKDEQISITENGTYLFNSKLKENESYRVEILSQPIFQTCAMTNDEGSAEGDHVEVMLDCSDKTWTYPEDLNTDHINPTGTAGKYKIAMNDNGDAIVVWVQYSDDHLQIFMSEYRNGMWNHPVDINDHISPAGSWADYPDIAISNNGEAVIVWRQFVNEVCYGDPEIIGCQQIFMSEYRNGAWTHPNDISDTINPYLTEARTPLVDMDAAGNTMIIWQQDGDDFEYIWNEEDQRFYLHSYRKFLASFYRNGTWDHPGPGDYFLDTNFVSSNSLDLRMDTSGNALLIWGSSHNIYKSEYIDGTWTHPVDENDFINFDSSYADSFKFAMDDNGNAIITWLQLNADGDPAIYKAERKEGNWIYPDSLNSSFHIPEEHFFDWDIAMSDSGKAFITWITVNAYYGNDYRLYIAEYNGESWNIPGFDDQINPRVDAYAGHPNLATDNTGNVILVWEQVSLNGYEQIFVSQYVDGQWHHPLDGDDNISPNGSNAYAPIVGMDSNGSGVILWQQINNMANNQLYMSEFR